MGLTLVQEGHVSFLEGPSGEPLMESVEDVRSVLEQYLSHRVTAVLLYAPNLTANFFDLRSGEAGAVLQKLFQYRVRLAIVCTPGIIRPGSRFGEVLVEEESRGRMGLFDSAESARAWIARVQGGDRIRR
ncbi:MAG: DUF4180 domain-containing protein [Chloroflexi bacterium]|nr:DUF4180 domain-containing protein [Chloroflexota bacterium]